MDLSNIYIITYTSYLPKTKYLQESEKLFNCKINYINGKWHGWYSKIDGIKDFINNCRDNDIIILVDAHDVILSGDIEEIYNKFKSYKCDILFGAELNCYPLFLKKDMDKIMPVDIKNKYINSGGYVGYVSSIKKMLYWKELDDLKEICKDGGDQTYVMKFYIEHHDKLNLKLDINSSIFQNMHLILWKELEINNGRVYNKIMKTYPCFVHFNGGSWRTEKKDWIIPKFIELMKKSKENKNIFTLDEYEQLKRNDGKPKAERQI